MAKEDIEDEEDIREERDSDISEKLLLKPLNLEKFGTKDDPCFGKLYDLRAPECQVCGDFEACSVAYSQRLHDKRSKFEEENPMKDLEEIEITDTRDEIEKMIKTQKQKKIPTYLIRVNVSHKFPDYPVEKIRELIIAL